MPVRRRPGSSGSCNMGIDTSCGISLPRTKVVGGMRSAAAFPQRRKNGPPKNGENRREHTLRGEWMWPSTPLISTDGPWLTRSRSGKEMPDPNPDPALSLLRRRGEMRTPSQRTPLRPCASVMELESPKARRLRPEFLLDFRSLSE